MAALIGGLLLCAILLGRRLFTMLATSNPYWGGSVTEGHIDKLEQPTARAIQVGVTALALAVSVTLAALFIWSSLEP